MCLRNDGTVALFLYCIDAVNTPQRAKAAFGGTSDEAAMGCVKVDSRILINQNVPVSRDIGVNHDSDSLRRSVLRLQVGDFTPVIGRCEASVVRRRKSTEAGGPCNVS